MIKRIIFTIALLIIGSTMFAKPERNKKVLVIAERGDQHEAFTAVALDWLKTESGKMGFTMTEETSMKDFPAKKLFLYDLIIQLNYPPYAWSTSSQKDFIKYIEQGKGGYIGFHHATLLGEFDGYSLWPWFSQFMGGIQFKSYIAPLADGVVQVEDTAHPVMKGVPKTFIIPKDEWYTYDCNPRPLVHVLAHVDESSYVPASNIKMGDHPVIWTNPKVKARNVYFQMGHHPILFSTPVFTQMFENALRWTLTGK